MTAKIIKGTSFSGAIGYMLSKKEKAEILKAEGVRIEPKELTAKSFELQASMHPDVKKPVWHISLNFSEQDKDKLTNEKMVEIAEAYLQKMNIGNTQYLIVRHHDRKHPHIHLCINRVDNNGKLISDKNEKFRSTKICRELTEKHGFYISQGKENVNCERLIGYDKTKYEIYDALQQAIPNSKTWSELENQLRRNGISFQFKTNGKTANIQGIIFEKDSIKINGSKVDRNCSFSKIDRQIKDNAYQALQEVAQQAQSASTVSKLGSKCRRSTIGTYYSIQPVYAIGQSALRRHTCRLHQGLESQKAGIAKQNSHSQNTIKKTTTLKNQLIMTTNTLVSTKNSQKLFEIIEY